MSRLRASTYVGRVGGLAVALGVGVLAFGGAGTALAAPGTDSAGATSDTGPARSNGEQSSTQSSTQRQQGNVSQRRTGREPATSTAANGRRGVPAEKSPIAQLATSASEPGSQVPAPAPQTLAVVRLPNSVSGSDPAVPAQLTTAWSVLAVARREQAATKPADAVSATSTSLVSTSVSAATATAAAPGIFGIFSALFSNVTPTMHPTQSGQSASGQVGGALNAVDDDSATLKYTVTAVPKHGSVVIAADGSYTYTPDAAYARTGISDTFSVSVSDESSGFHIHGLGGLLSLLTFGLIGGGGHTASSTVPVVVTAWQINNVPIGSATVGSVNALTGVVTGVVSGIDADGDSLTFTTAGATAKGAVTLSSTTGAFTYTPTEIARHGAASLTATAADKEDTFAVTIADGYGGSVVVPVTVAIGASNAVPVVAAPTVSAPDLAVGRVTGRLTATDADGDAVTFGGTTSTAKGAVSVDSEGAFVYTPTLAARHAASALGATVADRTDTFALTVNDGHGGTVTVPVSVSISPSNAEPIVGNSIVQSANSDTGVIIGKATGVDPDGDALSYSGSATTSKGAVLVAGDGTFTYTPTAAARHAAAADDASAATKLDTFVIMMSDGHGGTAVVPVTVTVTAANAEPVAGPPIVGAANVITGVVTGHVAATDLDSDSLKFSGTATTPKGAVTVNPDGTFTYTPTATARHAAASDTAGAEEQIDTFMITIADGHGGSVAVAVKVGIGPSNAIPNAGNLVVDSPDISTGVTTGSLAASDADGDYLTFGGTTSTDKGSVTVNSDGSFVYTPSAGARHAASALAAAPGDLTDAFVITIDDGHGAMVAVPVVVTITPVNSDPVAAESLIGSPDAATGKVTGKVVVTDADGDTLSYGGADVTAKGTFVLNSDGTFSYTPTGAARHAASALAATADDKADSVTVTVSDGHGATITVGVAIPIGPSNAAPVATSPVVGSPSGATGSVTGSVVATDADGDALTYSGTTVTAKGAVTVNSNGTFSYTPNTVARHAASALSATMAEKTDVFTVTVIDGHGGTTTVPVTVDISPANTAPVVGSPTINVANASGVVSGSVAAVDADGDVLTYNGMTTAKGAVVVNSDGTFTYTPSADARHAASAVTASAADRQDTFAITIIDGHGATVSVPIQVGIAPANSAPVAGSPILGDPDVQSGAVAGRAVVTDGDGDVITYSGTTTTAKGAVAVDPDGTFTYLPNAVALHNAASASATAADKTDTFTITATDGHGGTVTIPVSVPLTPANHAPVVTGSTTGTPNAATGVVIGSVTVADADGDHLTYSGTTTTAKGLVVVNSDGTYTYTPMAAARHAAASLTATAAEKADTFTISVSDGHGATLTVPVSVAIGPANSAPVAGNPMVTAPDSSTGVVAGAVLALDNDGDTLSYSAPVSTSKGAVVLNSDGTFTYTPTAAARHAAAGLNATAAQKTDTFSITIIDGHGATLTVPVSVAIAPANAAPVAGSPSVTAPDASTGVVTGRVTASDADGDALAYSGSATTAKGAVVVNSDGTFSYTPTATARHAASALTATVTDKADTFIVTVTDGHGATVAVPVSVTIGSSNAAPIVGTPAVNDPDSSGVVTGAVIANDPDGDTLIYSAPATTTKGAVTVNSNGTFTYTPTKAARDAAAALSATDADKTDSFTVTISDGHGATVAIPVAVAVAPSPATVSFNFVYGTGAQLWTAPARTALQAAADILSSYLVVSTPVTLTYTVIGSNTPNSGTLATAYAFFSSSDPGFYGTVVQTKILTGVDTNGAAADGQITWNFAYPYAYVDSTETTPNNAYDFTAVALHELLHTFGFISGIGNPSALDTNWTTYDSWLVDATGTKLIGSNYVWNTAYNANLTGGNGGIYFGGENAVAAYGGLVPLYTPSTWASGSSLSHLEESNDHGDDQVMNAFLYYGPLPRVLSDVEVGMLKDLGYSVSSGSSISAFAIFGFGFLRMKRRKKR